MNEFAKFLEINSLKQAEVAEYLSVAPSFITKLLHGERKLPPEKLDRLRDRLDWDSSMLVASSGRPGPVAKRERPAPAPSGIPLLPFSAVAGYMTDNNRLDSLRCESVAFKDFSDRGADCMIRVDGDSMVPRYNSGDVLAIRILKDPTFFQWGKVYVISTTQGCVIKKLFPDPDDREAIICHSENSESYPDYRITKEDILAIAIVVGHAGVE